MLLRGVGESAAEWRPVQQALSRAYDVIGLDFPGFGGSARLPANALAMAVALADAVEREIDQLGIGDFHVAGYSLGARVSLELATRGRIRSVVAIAPNGKSRVLTWRCFWLDTPMSRSGAYVGWCSRLARTGDDGRQVSGGANAYLVYGWAEHRAQHGRHRVGFDISTLQLVVGEWRNRGGASLTTVLAHVPLSSHAAARPDRPAPRHKARPSNDGAVGRRLGSQPRRASETLRRSRKPNSSLS